MDAIEWIAIAVCTPLVVLLIRILFPWNFKELPKMSHPYNDKLANERADAIADLDVALQQVREALDRVAELHKLTIISRGLLMNRVSALESDLEWIIKPERKKNGTA